MTDPKRPYLLFHPKFICKFGSSWRDYGHWDFRVTRKDFAKQWWKDADCFAIDADCCRFELVDVVSKGPAWTIWNLFQAKREVYLATEHILSRTAQLTFDEARYIFVEYVCDHRWWTASNETEKQFRERNAKYETWEELIKPVSLKGRWP